MNPGEGGEGWTSQAYLRKRSQGQKKWGTGETREKVEKWIFPRMEFGCWKIPGREQKHWKR